MPSRPTFSTVLNSGLPQAVGLCSQDRMAVAAYVNEAQERLVTDPLTPNEGWYGGWMSMLFNVTVTNFTATIIAPREVARIIDIDVCQRPRPIRNQFFEFLQFGIGAQPRPCNKVCNDIRAAFERDNVPLLAPFPTSSPQFIRFYISDLADVGKRVVVQGEDKNGKQVLGTDPITGGATIGEQVTLISPFATTVNEYQQIDGFLKDVTKGPVTVFAVDPVSLTQTEISSMEINETTPSYRQYQLVGIPPHCCNTPLGITQIKAMCRRELVPVINDTDALLITSLPALIEESMAIRFGRMDAPQSVAFEQRHHARAISILNGQLDLYEGKSSTAVSVPLFGSQKLRPNPV